MAQIIFTPTVGDAVTVDTVPGSISYGDGSDDRGGGLYPNARAGIAKNGSCMVIIDSAGLTLVEALALRSPAGAGNFTITGTGIKTAEHSYEALVDVTIQGDAVQVANITWKGTIT